MKSALPEVNTIKIPAVNIYVLLLPSLEEIVPNTLRSTEHFGSFALVFIYTTRSEKNLLITTRNKRIRLNIHLLQVTLGIPHPLRVSLTLQITCLCLKNFPFHKCKL
jgi:hypothetical protein